MTVILSIFRKFSESTSRCWKGFSARDTSVGVTSFYSCQVCQADCLPFPTNAEVVLQPLSAWNTGRQRALVSPRETHTLLTLIKWKCFPIPKAIQMSASDLSAISRSNFPTRITTTSVSTVRIRTLVQPDCRACNTWITILVSASSWLHGGMGVAADPHDVTDCPERAKVTTEHRYQNNTPGATLQECPHLPDVIWRAFPAGTLMPATLELRKIGRASCRERV